MSTGPNNSDQIALRKQLIQMRLELNRQKIRHEGMVLLEPVEKLRGFKKRLSSGSTPLLLVAGVTFASFFIGRNRRSSNSWLPMVRVAASLLPLFINSTDKADTTTQQADNLK